MVDSKKKNVVMAMMIIIMLLMALGLFVTTKELDRIRNDLTAKDAEIQSLDIELGISKSSLLEISDLNKKYENEIGAFPEKLKKIIDEYNLKLASRDNTIAELRNTIKGGQTEVVVNPNPDGSQPGQQSISYKWTDSLDRFHLVDPDIFIQNNEEFSYNQFVAIKGHILYGKDGKLQIRRVELTEVVPDGTDDSGKPKFKEVPGGKMRVVDSTFDYADIGHNERTLMDIFHPRLIASMDTQLQLLPPKTEIRPSVGVEVINFGRYIDHANLGVNAKITPNFDDIIGGSLLSSRLGVGLDYTLLPPILDTNLGLGVGVSTPSNNLLNEWYLTVDAVFYISN